MLYIWAAVRRGAMDCTSFWHLCLYSSVEDGPGAQRIFFPSGHSFCSMMKLGGVFVVGCRDQIRIRVWRRVCHGFGEEGLM